jgi:hypothetical protein
MFFKCNIVKYNLLGQSCFSKIIAHFIIKSLSLYAFLARLGGLKKIAEKVEYSIYEEKIMPFLPIIQRLFDYRFFRIIK